MPSSMTPLPRHMQCHRCKTLEMDCIVWDGDRKASSKNNLRYGPPQGKAPSPSRSDTSKVAASDSSHRKAESSDPTTASEVVDTFSLWATVPRKNEDPFTPLSSRSDQTSTPGSSGRYTRDQAESSSSKRISPSEGDLTDKGTQPGHVNPLYRSKLAMAYDRNAAQVAEIVYRSPHYAERSSIVAKMMYSTDLPMSYERVSKAEKSRMKAFILANPWLDPEMAEAAPANSLSPLDLWLRNVSSYISCRPKHTDQLLASILGKSVYHSLMQTRSLTVCRTLLLLAIHEPIDLIFSKPSTEIEEIIDRAPGHTLFAAAYSIALAFRLDETIPNMRSGSNPLTPSTPRHERESRLRDAALWLALHNFGISLCEPGIKPRLPPSAPTQLDIETFESNVRFLLPSGAKRENKKSQNATSARFPDLYATALLAHSYSAKYNRRLRTYWSETELLTVRSPDFVPSTRHFCLSLKADGEAILSAQIADFASLPTHPALELVNTLARLKMSDILGRISAALLFTFGAHVAQKHGGAFMSSNILKGMNAEPASLTALLPEMNDLSEQMFRETLRLGLRISGLELDLLSVVPPIMFSTSVFSAAKHLIERQVFVSSNPKTRHNARPEDILQVTREGISALEKVARGHRASIPYIIHEVLFELTRRFSTAVDVFKWNESGVVETEDQSGKKTTSTIQEPSKALARHHSPRSVEAHATLSSTDSNGSPSRSENQHGLGGLADERRGPGPSTDHSGRKVEYHTLGDRTPQFNQPGYSLVPAPAAPVDAILDPSGTLPTNSGNGAERFDAASFAGEHPQALSHIASPGLNMLGSAPGYVYAPHGDSAHHHPMLNNPHGANPQATQAASLAAFFGDGIVDLTSLFDWGSANDPSGNNGALGGEGSGFHW
ncbi:unnamed protein product [Sympodiomycopsis kandeliae]